MTKLSANRLPKPIKVTPKLFALAKKLKANNPNITAEGITKMMQGQIGRSTVNIITKCDDYESYVWVLSKIAEIERLKKSTADGEASTERLATLYEQKEDMKAELLIAKIVAIIVTALLVVSKLAK